MTVSVPLAETQAIDEAFAPYPVESADSQPAGEAATSSAPNVGDGLSDPSVTAPYPVSLTESSPESALPEAGGLELPSIAPTIEDLSRESEGNFWRFSGRVSDDGDVNGLQVRFGGLLEGMTATVNEEGYFEIVVMLSLEHVGMVTAISTDVDGQDSPVAYWIVN